jgi:hypothetical protein
MSWMRYSGRSASVSRIPLIIAEGRSKGVRGNHSKKEMASARILAGKAIYSKPSISWIRRCSAVLRLLRNLR